MPHKMRAVYPGSFDPITLGHLDIITRLSPMYDEFIVLIANSPEKSYLFSAQERVELVKKSVKNFKNVKVDIFDGLTVDYAKSKKADVIIRGLRAVSDFEYEFAMANMNKTLNPEVETLIVFTHPEYSHIASRMVKEVAFYNGELKGLVPQVVVEALKNRIIKKGKKA